MALFHRYPNLILGEQTPQQLLGALADLHGFFYIQLFAQMERNVRDKPVKQDRGVGYPGDTGNGFL
ncbi:hypothetical protein D3C71_1945590 [compost metagenome]